MVTTDSPADSLYLKDGRDEHGVGVGKAEEGGVGICSLLEVANSPNHGRVLHRSVIEMQLGFWAWMLRRTKGMVLSAVSI